MKLRYVLSVCFVFMTLQVLFAQKSYYTVLQGGGQIGLHNPDYKGAFSGYGMHFILGQNFDDRAFVGLGFGNETYRGDYQVSDPNDPDQGKRDYDTYMMPIFIDGRLPVSYVGRSSRIGLFANAGYAPRMGPVYDKGFLLKGGLFYLYETMGRTNYTLSASYGYQELQRNAHHLGKAFQHQHLAISVGIMFK